MIFFSNTIICEKELINQPTIFYVSSPFQILCAIEVIYYYKISKYKFILGTTDDIRDKQMFELLNQLKIDYELFRLNKLTNKTRILLTLRSYLKHNKVRYNQAFMGDYFTLDFCIHSLQYLQRRANIIYLDDGTSTIAILNGQIQTNFIFKIKKAIISLNLLFKGINSSKYYFTLFSDIKNERFICFENKFSFMKKKVHNSSPTDIYFIGTNVDRYCSVFDIKISDFILKLKTIFDDLMRTKQDNKIIYIPHGRDLNNSIRELCATSGIEYRRLNVAVEYYMFKENIYPKFIYGFTSTALINLKKMYPNTFVSNIRIKGNNPHYNQLYDTISSYYEHHGISLYNEITL